MSGYDNKIRAWIIDLDGTEARQVFLHTNWRQDENTTKVHAMERRSPFADSLPVARLMRDAGKR